MGGAVSVGASPLDQKSLAEIIAQLDVFERDLLGMVKRLREYKYTLAQTLDNDPDGLVD